MNNIKRVAAIHDISCFGKSSLTIIMPVLSVLNCEVCPLPTALLSTHTGFSNAEFFDLSEEIKKIISHWKKLNINFNCIYSGFLGSSSQIEIVKDFFKFFGKNALKVVDPVMGDNGKLYSTYNLELCNKVTELVKHSDIITPNLTEAAILLNKEYSNNIDDITVEKYLIELSVLGPSYPVITGIIQNEKIYNYAYSKSENKFYKIGYPYINKSYDGTGDLFAAVLTGCFLESSDFELSLNKASEFVYKVIKYTNENYESDIYKVIKFEPLLNKLTKGDQTK